MEGRKLQTHLADLSLCFVTNPQVLLDHRSQMALSLRASVMGQEEVLFGQLMVELLRKSRWGGHRQQLLHRRTA